jgi:hypothetical protein
LLDRLAACTTVQKNTATFSTISAATVTGLAASVAPATVRPYLGLGAEARGGRGPVGAAAPTHSTHW